MRIMALAVMPFITCLLMFSPGVINAQAGTRPNFIFIVADDLNDYVEGFNGQPQIETPSLVSLEENGMLFTNAFCNAPVCGPSRTSFLSGKDIYYTQVYDNNEYIDDFRSNFTAAKNNEEVITLPEHLKNEGGYYTMSINKVFHNPWDKDLDTGTPDPCEKSLSWSRCVSFGDYTETLDYFATTYEGVNKFKWGLLDDSVESIMKDVRAVDTAIRFIHDIASGAIVPCEGAFFLGVGLALPHLDLYVPEQYFSEEYVQDIFEVPFDKPYNDPVNAFPYNGIVMPPQPVPAFSDYDNLGPLGKEIATGQYNMETSFTDYYDSLATVPEIDPGLSDEERAFILMESKKANAVMAYMAGIQFMDKQIGRLLDSLAAYPAISENTIIIFIGDNGFSFGEKYHWLKRSFWETDARVPFIIADPSRPGGQICNKPVALLDLYPTICDLAGISYPVFSDSSYYLDGKTILPLLDDPLTEWERPVLMTFEEEENKECSCFPQYAVRWDRFKYILYTSDGGNPYDECNADSSFNEEELYEIGIDRETDPNEWNNLISNNDYLPVINYLRQWLPGSPLYLQKTFKAHIDESGAGCLADYSDTIDLHFSLFDTNGICITAPLGYTYRWTNNLTDDTVYGNWIQFPVSNIPPDSFAIHEKVIFYLEMVDDVTNVISGFDIRYLYIDPINAPSVTFHVSFLSPTTVQVSDVVITHSYNDIWWDMGDGTTIHENEPGPYTYAAEGTYSIVCFVQFGNDSSCLVSFTEDEILVSDSGTKTDLLLYPNPADSYLQVACETGEDPVFLKVISLTGQVVSTDNMEGTSPFTIETSSLPQGNYILQVIAGKQSYAAGFSVVH